MTAMVMVIEIDGVVMVVVLTVVVVIVVGDVYVG